VNDVLPVSVIHNTLAIMHEVEANKTNKQTNINSTQNTHTRTSHMTNVNDSLAIVSNVQIFQKDGGWGE